jgi:hypothetical protein
LRQILWIIWSSGRDTGTTILQYWYYQYFSESSSICNTGITSISQNLPLSTILIFWQWPVSSSIADTGKILVIPVLQILKNTGYTSIADIGRLGRIPLTRVFMSTLY